MSDLTKADVLFSRLVRDPRDTVALAEGETDLSDQMRLYYQEGAKP